MMKHLVLVIGFLFVHSSHLVKGISNDGIVVKEIDTSTDNIKISLYKWNNFRAYKIKNSKKNTTEYTAYEIRMREQIVFLWQKKSVTSQTCYDTLKEVYKNQQKNKEKKE